MIYKTEKSEELSEYELKDVSALQADWFVYYYEHGSYEGTGFAVWKKDNKYYYDDLGHCSCYGPTDGLKNTGGYDSLEDIDKIDKNYNEGENVMKFIKENNLS